LDVYDPAAFEGDILCSLPERMALRSLINLGMCDVLRAKNPDAEGLYTWWDYRQGGFARNRGVRIDHFLASHRTMKAVQDVGVDVTPRGWERPSDHAPVWVQLDEDLL
jgi:exodeoxyribonuclease-3